MLKSTIEVNTASTLIKLGDLVFYKDEQGEELALAISNVDKKGNFKGVILHSTFESLPNRIGATVYCHTDNYTKFSGKLTLETK